MPLPDKFNISGTPEQIAIVLPILEAMYLGFKDIESGGGTYSRPLPNDVKGKIYIKLYFQGIIKGTMDAHRVEKTFRLIHEDPKTISLEKLKALGNRTKQKFDDFSFTTGVSGYCYNNPDQGFNRIWGFFNSVSDAKKLFEQLLDIPQLSPDWKRLTCSTVVDPGDRFQDPPEKEMQAGQMIRLDRERPIALMKFKKAAIKFPKVRSEADLVDKHGVVIDSLDFLQKYA